MSNDDIDSAVARAAHRYFWKRYQNTLGGSRKRECYEAFEAGYRAALAQCQAEPELSPAALIWERMGAHQRFADTRGYGDAWATMCRERTHDAFMRAYDALYAAENAALAAYRSALKAAKALPVPLEKEDGAYADAQAAKAAARAKAKAAKLARRAMISARNVQSDKQMEEWVGLAEAKVFDYLEQSEAQ